MEAERNTGAMKKTGYGRFNPQTQLRLKSGLEMHREMETPSVIEGEEIIMSGQASYQDGMVTRTNWKPGYLYLTKERLVFMQGASRLFDVALNSLEEMSIVQRDWVPNKKVEQLHITQKNNGVSKVFYLFAKNLEEWKQIIVPQESPLQQKGSKP